MSFASGFHGTVGGSVQSSYADQPGVGISGMLAFASDINKCDSMYISDAAGVAAGKGVKKAQLTDAISLQSPNQSVLLPTGSETVADFVGVLVFDETMQTNENGIPGWATGRMGSVLRYSRVGGRVYVKVREAVTAGSSTVNWVTTAGTNNTVTYEAGEFSPAACSGGSAVSTAITGAKWVTSASAGGVAIMEFPVS